MQKRKQPMREDKQLHERDKITAHVFDAKTLEVLIHFLNNGVITSVDYPIAEGKEAGVYKASSKQGDVAVKIFKYETSSFLKRSMLKYIEGDPRFPSLNMGHRLLVQLWARKEYSNLLAASKAGVSVPLPIKHRQNVVAMKFIGESGVPFPLLKDAEITNAGNMFGNVVKNMQKLWKAGFVHADLNEFNIITDGRNVWFIDFAQGVRKEHPHAGEFLEKDCENIAKYFSKRGVDTSKEKVTASVLKL
ncbi:serine protein kinase RIO [Candidatus Micrarchaeota archaeon]|nr:serine protein kinase RIO [Candidatus Micrarchaeota archaeon]